MNNKSNFSVRKVIGLAIAFFIVAVGAIYIDKHPQLARSGSESPANDSQGNTVLGSSEIGHAAPDFTVKTLEGQTITLSKVLGQKPIVLNFWASWCGPCQDETPDVVKTFNKYKDTVLFYGINATSQDNLKDVKSFAAKYQLEYPVLLDTHGEVLQKYGIIGFPTTFVLSSKGTILSSHVGSLSSRQLQAMIAQALKQSS